MFKIDEIRFITELIDNNFYLSPKSTFEYMTTYDIETMELLVEFDITKWLKKLKLNHNVSYQKKGNKYFVEFLDEKIDASFISISDISIDDYLSRMCFNIEAIAIKISCDVSKGFTSYKNNNKTYYANWIDPFSVKEDIEANYIAPINYKTLIENSELIFKIVAMMSIHGFDIKKESIMYLKKYKDKINYKSSEMTNQYLFLILERVDSYKYLKILDELEILEEVYPFINEMKAKYKNGVNLWEFGLICLNKIESIIYSEGYFVDSIARAYKRNCEIKFPSGITKVQMLKFAALFHNVNFVIQIPLNLTNQKSDDFFDFCSCFDFGKDECIYFSQVIQTNTESISNIRDDILNGNKASKENQYEFYDDFKNNTLDVLLIQFVDMICADNFEEQAILSRLENLAKNYMSKYCELESINAEITSLDLNYKEIGDMNMLLLLNDVKKKIFLGILNYDRQTIINYIEDIIKKTS